MGPVLKLSCSILVMIYIGFSALSRYLRIPTTLNFSVICCSKINKHFGLLKPSSGMIQCLYLYLYMPSIQDYNFPSYLNFLVKVSALKCSWTRLIMVHGDHHHDHHIIPDHGPAYRDAQVEEQFEHRHHWIRNQVLVLHSLVRFFRKT